MLSQYYIKTQNRINYAKKYPNSGIKCSVCQLIFSIHQIQNHMSTHISPQYMAPNTKSNEIKKMNRPQLFLQEKQNQFMSSALNSIRKQQLPKDQKVRNFKTTPSNFYQVSNSLNPNSTFYGTVITNSDETQAETALEIYDVQKDQLPRQNIKENLLLDKQNVQIQKNFIQTYSSIDKPKHRISFQTTQNNWTKSTRIQGKKWQNMKIDNKQTKAYEITTQKQQKIKSFLPIFQVEPQQKFEVNLQKYKPPEVKNQSICTKTGQNKQLKKSSSFQFLASIFGCQQASTETKKGQIVVNMTNGQTTGSFWKTNTNGFNGKYTEHKCNDCGGFYCGTCHSTIPPQYRPANVFQKDQKITQFYRNIVYDKQCGNNISQFNRGNDCKDCNQ